MKRPYRWLMCGAISIVTFVVFNSVGFAAQFDAPFYELKNKHEEQWSQEDKNIEVKLAKLETRFGQKPNIIYILTDDIGYGELGVQGGGSVRGAPTPEIDKMAQEGVLLNGFYSEPS